MKKALTLVVLIVTPPMIFAQGTVTFWNQTGLVKQWTSTSDTTLINVPQNGGYAEMFSALAGTAAPTALFSQATGGQTANYTTLAAFLAANPAWSTTPGTTVPAPMWIGPGLFSGGTYTIPGVDGDVAQYFAVGWTGSATSFDQALASGTAFMGESAIFTTKTTPFAANPGTPTSLRLTFGGMTLTPIVTVPEPTSFALAGLGLVALLVFHRRR